MIGSIDALAFGKAEKGAKLGSTGDSDDAVAANTPGRASTAGGGVSKKLASDIDGGEFGGAWVIGTRELAAGFVPIVSDIEAGPPCAARAGAKELAPIFFSPPAAGALDGKGDDDAAGCAGDGAGDDRADSGVIP